MFLLAGFLRELHEYLTGKPELKGHLIRLHTKKLLELGDISFPISASSWAPILGETTAKLAVFAKPEALCAQLLKKSVSWGLELEKYHLRNADIHLFFKKAQVIGAAVNEANIEGYGLEKIFKGKVHVTCDVGTDLSVIGLTELRVLLMQQIAGNILESLTEDSQWVEETSVEISHKSGTAGVFSGPVLNENGVKSCTTAQELIGKRSLDMQLMAQHKYGVQVKPTESWLDYFKKLGTSCVTIELLQSRPHKALKIALNSPQTSNKGPAFLFYNCARLAVLFKEFEARVESKIYPALPAINEVDFGLLDQPEEWEMVFVYILQYPGLLRSVVSDLVPGRILNVHYLVTFLSNLCSVFSVYYRRVKVLTIPKEQLLRTLYARIYLLKAIQHIFHQVLRFLGIDPIKEM